MELKKLVNLYILLLLTASCQKEERENIFVIQGEAQGSTYALKYISKTKVVSKQSIDSLLLAFDRSLSTYRPDSKIAKINEGDSTVVVDDFFVETFNTSQAIYRETEGLFDPTIGVLVNAYGFGPRKDKINLNQTSVDSLLRFVGFDKVKLNPNKTVTKQFKETYFDFNAIAQGYSVDVVVDFLKSKYSGLLN